MPVMAGLFSCSNSKPAPPIPLKEMQSIMMDLHLAEYYSQNLKKDSVREGRTEKNMDSLATFYNAVFDHHHITLEDYNKAFSWYASHPEMLDSIYSGMIATTSELKIKYPEKVKPTNADTLQQASNQADSLRKAMQEKRDSINHRLLPRHAPAKTNTPIKK